MNTQRKVVITTTYNEMGIIIDTKAEEVAQPNTTTHDSIPAETGENDGVGTSGDCISRTQAIDAIKKRLFETAFNNVGIKQSVDETLEDVAENRLETWFDDVPPARPFHIITMTDVMKFIDDMPEDVWLEFTCCLECRGWELQRRTAKWCGGDFA